MINYDTVSEAVNGLLQRGYNATFSSTQNKHVDLFDSLTSSLAASDFVIDEVHRFEGITDPADEAIVYAVSSKKLNAKAIVVNGYGVYADSFASSIVQTLFEDKLPE